MSLPEDVIIRWIEKHGLEGARMLARHVPGPFISDKGPDLHRVTRYILEHHGNDERVFGNWHAGMHHGRVFTGSIADHTESQADRAKPFLHFPIEAVRRWAQGQIRFAQECGDRFRSEEEER